MTLGWLQCQASTCRIASHTDSLSVDFLLLYEKLLFWSSILEKAFSFKGWGISNIYKIRVVGNDKEFTQQLEELLHCDETRSQRTCFSCAWLRSVFSGLKALSPEWVCSCTDKQQSGFIELSNATVCLPVTASAFTQRVILMWIFPNHGVGSD